MIVLDDIRKTRIKAVRKQIMQILHLSGLAGATETVLSMSLEGYGHQVLPAELRQHLDYMEQRGVLKILDRDKSIWAAKLTPDGTDLAEGTAKTPDWLKA